MHLPPSRDPDQPDTPVALDDAGTPRSDAPVAPARASQSFMVGAVGIIFVVVGIAALTATGQLRLFILSGVQVWPFLLLASFGTIAPRHAWARNATMVWLAVVMVGLVVVSVGFAIATVIQIGPKVGIAGFNAAAGRLTLSATVAMALCALFSLVWLARPARVAVSRLMAIDPDDVRHTVALIALTDLVLSAIGLLAILHGRPPLLTMVQNTDVSGGLGTGPAALLATLYELFWTVPLAFVAAGVFSRRTPRQTFGRLGLVAPKPEHIAIGLGFGVAFIVASGGVDLAIAQVFKAMHWPQTDTASFEKLLGSAISPIGALVIGVTAGLGEELSVRGLLQPRFGLIGSNLVFASAHAYQYGFDALLSVFLLGLALGLIRARWSTSVSAITHGSYDGIAILAAALQHTMQG